MKVDKMKCPYCNEEMRKGYIQSAREIFWGQEKHIIFFTPHSDDEFAISNGFLNGSTTESYYCIKCKKLIVQL